ncbi:molybdopterin-dependent oxidoreductase [Spinactinospora alkalitolerans]|nr:molybdopterin-dependent oxidoreductase [Spinactinospora alkalitolerans]
MTTASNRTDRPPRGRRIALGAVTGLLTAAAALGAAELTAGLLGSPQASPVVVVGDAVVDYSPAPLKEFAIAVFGIYDKVVLLAGIVAVLALFAVAIGYAALRRPAVGYAGLAVFAAVGVVAAFARRNVEPLAVLPVLVGVLVGAAALYLLSARAVPLLRTGSQAGQGGGMERRRFMLAGAGVLALAGASGGIGRFLVGGSAAGASRSAVRLPTPDSPLPPLPKGVDLDVPGLTPFTTPNREFYRIDTALTVPRVSPQDWGLRVHGLVDRPVELDFETLLRRSVGEYDITMTCVSNQVGGELVGNTRWLGVSLAELLREAGVQGGADQILSTSTDGWTCGTPTDVVMDGRDAILAFAMNGEPLPFEHGFPVRMVVPGLYGYVSATKWVTDIKLTRFADEQAYWAQRGWAVKAPIKTMSRIDVPGPLERLEPGTIAVAGVAWAQHRGVEAVEVRVDEGEWSRAELAEVPDIDTWRQWIWEWEATEGRHTLEVRATDATGYTQTSERAEPIPDGASGWHSVQVIVE